MRTITYQLTASIFGWSVSDNKTIEAWGFNHAVPGPTIRASKGDFVVVNVKNDLPEPTIVHWHGVRLESAMDGTSHTQKPIQPGEEFQYRFIVPDPGTFWYHSHHNETVQMERGMYGALIVDDPGDPVLDAEKIFVIDDMKLDRNNKFLKGNAIARWAERHDGREGDTLLINGRENSIFRITGGHQERWRFINASSAKYFQLYLGGRRFKVVATDGGLIQRSEETDKILIVPGERVDIIAGPFIEGDVIQIESLPYNRMTFTKAKRQTYATVLVEGQEESNASVPQVLRHIQSLASPDALANRHVKLSVGPSLRYGINFLVNGHVHDMDKPVVAGDLQVWEVANTSLMDHPFHLHGFFFQVLQVNGKAVENVSWKDTVNLPPRSRVKIAWMPDNRPGTWMYHCHILEHHEAGMMSHFKVVEHDAEFDDDPIYHYM